MNGRVFAVNRSPVLAWNVEVPYPDMPAAAAAAISPIVPTASDPYGRCWQNQVDPGSSFPYFGALYNNSLPPTAYRLQPGCMPNLGQFWPPTPPPDGCGRFDGSNLYFGPPVLRHGDNVSSNMRNSFQSLGHYSHLVETPKESNQRLFKQETAISPNVNSSSIAMCSSGAKSDSLNACCVVESKLKSQCSVSRSLPKQELLTVSSGHEPYFFAPDIRSSSSMHPSTDNKSCFSSTYSLKSNLSIHSPPQENTHKSNKSLSVSQENNCNASPLKNVYFSHYESENVNSIQSKNDEQFYFEHKNLSLNSNKSRPQSSTDYLLSNHFSKKYDFHGVHDFHKGAHSQRASDVPLKEQYKQKSCSSRIKPEKANHSDCKYQKVNPRSSTIVQVSQCKNSDLLNIPTSVMHPKMEPKDKYFMSSCPSTASSCMTSSYATSSSPYLNSLSNTGVTSYQNNIYQNSCPLNKSWSYNNLPMINPDSYFKSPEAAKPPSQNQLHVTSALHEGLISVAQTAPSAMQMVKEAGNMLSQAHSSPIHQRKALVESDDDDDVQIIGVAMLSKSSSSKPSARCISSKRVDYHLSSPIIKPLCLKSENREINLQKNISSSRDQKLKPMHPLVERPDCIFNTGSQQSNCKESSEPINSTLLKSDVETVCQNATEVMSLDVAAPVRVKEEINEDTPITSKTKISKQTENFPDTKPNVDAVSNLETVIKESGSVPFDHPTIGKDNLDLNSTVGDNTSNSCKLELNDEVIEKQSLPEFSENHGLNLLLDTIEKVTSFEAIGSSKSNIIPTTSAIIDNSNDVEQVSQPSCNVLKIRGLELLSSIAVERLVSEFDVIKIQPKDSPVISNYPQIKEEPKPVPEEDLLKQNGETVVKVLKSTVFEMRDRLVELQKKYKQKQKELSRLKPKKRLANTYLKCCHKIPDESVDAGTVSSFVTNESFNTSLSSHVCSDHSLLKSENIVEESPPESNFKVENDDNSEKNIPKRSQRLPPFRKESSIEILSDEEVQEIYIDKQTTRRSSRRNSMKVLRSNLERKRLSVSMHSKIIKHSQRSKFLRLRKKDQSSGAVSDDVNHKQSSGSCQSLKTNSLPEVVKKSKAYSLRHLSQVSMKDHEPESGNLDSNSKNISSKRKSDNPKRYVPSKQGKISETIIAKHLRSRILFDTSGSLSDEENAKDSVPDDLYDALMKCHLVEENGIKTLSDEGSEISCDTHPLGHPEPSKLNLENLIERQRLLALEDGLFYAGYIKECQTSNRYGIALDGQRGNRLHTFTREELLTQTIVESKPISSELPEGTRVCAYWSQQYRCLYPGVIGKAPCPSADWSEPRVFVQFDDGDSGQIPTKNVRLIPLDIIPSGPESRLDSSSASSSHTDLKCKRSNRGQVPRRLRSSTPKKKHKGVSNENESKESSCTSINDSSCDDSCFMDYSLSPSQNMETLNNTDNNQSSNVDYSKSEKRQRKHSKRKITSRTKTRDCEYPETKGKGEAKAKRHKKYKDKHRRHHHHHHRHHHHHHHHHHSKKRKHRRKTGKSPTSQDLDYENCIPCKSNLKSHKAFEVACTDLIEHSSTIHLPQVEQDKV